MLDFLTTTLSFADKTTFQHSYGQVLASFDAESFPHTIETDQIVDDSDHKEWWVFARNNGELGDFGQQQQISHPEISTHIKGFGKPMVRFNQLLDTSSDGYLTDEGWYVGCRLARILGTVTHDLEDQGLQFDVYSSAVPQHVREWGPGFGASYPQDELSLSRPTMPGGRSVAFRVFATKVIDRVQFPKETISPDAVLPFLKGAKYEDLTTQLKAMYDTWAKVETRDVNGQQVWTDPASGQGESAVMHMIYGNQKWDFDNIQGVGRPNPPDFFGPQLLTAGQQLHPMHFGCFQWTDGMNSNHYEAILVALKAWHYSTQEDLGEHYRKWAWWLFDVMATWYATSGQVHSSGNVLTGCPFFEKSNRGNSSPTSTVSTQSYSGGLRGSPATVFKTYVRNFQASSLIGYKYTEDAKQKVFGFIRLRSMDIWNGSFGIRPQAWIVRNLVEMFKETGDPEDLARATNYIATNIPQFQLSGGLAKGGWNNSGNNPTGLSNTFSQAKMQLAIAEWEEAANDSTTFRQMLQDSYDFLGSLIDSYGTDHQYIVYQWTADRVPALYNGNGSGAFAAPANMPGVFEFTVTWVLRAMFSTALRLGRNNSHPEVQRCMTLYSRYAHFLAHSTQGTVTSTQTGTPGPIPDPEPSTTVTNIMPSIDFQPVDPNFEWWARTRRNMKDHFVTMSNWEDIRSLKLQIDAATPSGPTAPTAPTGLSSPGQTFNSIQLSWTDTSTNENAFFVESSSVGASGPFGTIGVADQDATSFNVQGLLASTQYWFRVIAVSETDGSSPPSAVFSATTAAMPVTLPLSATGLTTENVSHSMVVLTWVDNATNEDEYEVQRQVNGGGWQPMTFLPADSTTATDTSPVISSFMGYRVRPKNAAGGAPYTSITIEIPTPEVGVFGASIVSTLQSSGQLTSIGPTTTNNDPFVPEVVTPIMVSIPARTSVGPSVPGRTEIAVSQPARTQITVTR